MEKTIYCCLPPHPPFPTRFPTVCVYNCDFERVQVFHSLDNLDFLELDAIYCFLQTVSRNAMLATCNIIYIKIYLFWLLAIYTYFLATCNISYFFWLLATHILFCYLQHIHIFHLASYNTCTFFATCIIPDIQIL